MFARPLSALAGIAFALATVAASSSVSAQDVEAPSVSVRVGDLDLSRPQDLLRLDSRLKVAARQVCDSGVRDLRIRQIDGECRQQVLGRARAQMASRTGSRNGTELALRR